MRRSLLVVEIPKLLSECQRSRQCRTSRGGHAPCIGECQPETALQDHLRAGADCIPHLGSCFLRPFASLGKQRHRAPEIGCRSGELDSQGGVSSGGKRPVQRSAKIVDFLAIATKVFNGSLELSVACELNEQSTIEFRMPTRGPPGFA